MLNCRALYSAILVEKTQILWGIVIDIKYCGKYSKHWDLKEFMNIDIA